MLNFVWEASGGDNVLPKPYWANTSGNAIVRTLIQQADESTKGEIETLMEGETIEKPIHEDITYDEVEKSMDHIWNCLLYTSRCV